MQRAMLITSVIVALVIAGCTMPSGGSSDPEPNRTVTDSDQVVVTAELSADEIFEGQAVDLLVELTNNRGRPLENVRVDLANTGELTIARSQPPQQNVPDTACAFPYFEGRIGETATEQRCLWTLETGADMLEPGRESARFPLTLFVQYDSFLPVPDSIRAVFTPENDIRPGTVQTSSVSASNQDIELAVSYKHPRPAEEHRIQLTITVTERGDGRLARGDDGRKRVDLTFRGTLADAPLNQVETTCMDRVREREIVFPEGASSQTITCQIVLQEQDPAGKTFFLRPTVRYSYVKTLSRPLTVLAR